MMFRSKAHAVVADGHRQFAAGRRQGDVHPIGPRVAQGVVQRLHGDPVKRLFDGDRDILYVCRADLAIDARPVLDRLQALAQGVDQPLAGQPPAVAPRRGGEVVGAAVGLRDELPRAREHGGLPEADNEKFKGHAKAAFGLWGYSTKVNDQRDTDAGGNPVLRYQRGGYVLGERTLARLGDERFLSGFARYTWGDGDSTAVKNSLNLGLHLKGPLESRPDDVVGIAWSRAGMSRKWRDVQTVPGNTQASEDALEITWRFAVTPYLAIQPNYQYIRHPGGAAAPNAKLIGVRADLETETGARHLTGGSVKGQPHAATPMR